MSRHLLQLPPLRRRRCRHPADFSTVGRAAAAARAFAAQYFRTALSVDGRRRVGQWPSDRHGATQHAGKCRRAAAAGLSHRLCRARHHLYRNGRRAFSHQPRRRVPLQDRGGIADPARLPPACSPIGETYLADITEPDDVEIDREKLLGVLRSYFKLHNISADWNAVQSTNNDTLSVFSGDDLCPLEPNEKTGAAGNTPDLRARAPIC